MLCIEKDSKIDMVRTYFSISLTYGLVGDALASLDTAPFVEDFSGVDVSGARVSGESMAPSFWALTLSSALGVLLPVFLLFDRAIVKVVD